MKRFLLSLACLTAAFIAEAQTNNTPRVSLPPLDKSPMDMAYYPANYPVLKIQDKAAEPLVARVIYSRPLKAGRPVFGDHVPFNEIWRLGANEATEIEFYREVRIGNRKVPKGKYTVYAIATPGQWTGIFNRDTDTWGAFKYDEKKDVARLVVPVEKSEQPVEAFTIYFDRSAGAVNMIIAWDEARVAVPILLK